MPGQFRNSCSRSDAGFWLPAGLIVLLLGIGLWPATSVFAQKGEFELQIVDDVSGKPIAARVELRRSSGRSSGRVYRPPRTPPGQDYFYVNGRYLLKLLPGRYTFRIERGSEYLEQTGQFEMQRAATDHAIVRMRRFTDMKALGWWSGDLDVRLPVHRVANAILAEDLHFAVVPSWTAGTTSDPANVPEERHIDGNRYLQFAAGHDARAGGRLTVMGLSQAPGSFATSDGLVPWSSALLAAAHQAGAVHVAAEPFAWDLPLWVASGHVDSLMLYGPFLTDRFPKSDPPGFRRDPSLFPNPDGLGRWCQTIYYHLLNCGLRIPPTAGSGVGVSKNPAGFNRVYVHCGETMSPESWWDHLRSGRAIVTNGPILIPKVNGQLPGHVFRGYTSEAMQLKIALTLHTKERISYLEIVKNGTTVESISLDNLRAAQGRIPPLTFTESGWFLIRASVDGANSYRAVSSGPFYVEFDDQPRISRESTEFMLDWLRKGESRLQLSESQRAHVTPYYRRAQEFWQQKRMESNAD